jgi:two-component system, NtrC family, response regulator PilR
MSLKVAESKEQNVITSPVKKVRIVPNGVFSEIITCSREMQRIFAVLHKVARANSTVLILGESGTGKELVARAIHRASGRSGKLVPVNCGAIPEEILESELFGHERGAFTGAVSSRQGRFQLADGGTIFLDEIGEMSPKLQVKLLRVLQERTIDPVGSNKSINVDVRVLAATNKDLRQQVEQGRFREDLYYRLQVVPVELPPLRERVGDVSLLVNWFVQKASEELGVELPSLGDGFLKTLGEYSWPGNIRELENLTERLVLLGEGSELTVSDLPSYITESTGMRSAIATIDVGSETKIILDSEVVVDGIDFNSLVDAFESKLIISALNKTSWNKKAAAELLQLNRTTLVEKIRKKGLDNLNPRAQN